MEKCTVKVFWRPLKITPKITLKIISVIFIFVLLPMASQAKGLCVNAEFANLRKGPGQQFAKSWVVYRYMPLEALEKKNGWYRVKDLENKDHWVREDLVTTSFKCAVIKADFANLRKGPGLNYPQKTPFRGERYLSFRLLAKRGDWSRVEDQEGDIVWIHNPLLWVR